MLPAVSALASLGAAVFAPPLLAFASVLVSLALLVLGQLVWRLLDEDDQPSADRQ